MTITFRTFTAEHLRYLSPQAGQRYDHAILLNTQYAEIVSNNFGLSGWEGSRCVGAAGVVPIFAHRAVAWAILSNDAAPYMLQIVRKARSYLAMTHYQRIEIAVRADFEEGHRFARLIGMQLETPEPMRKHGANGEDEMMYAVTK